MSRRLSSRVSDLFTMHLHGKDKKDKSVGTSASKKEEDKDATTAVATGGVPAVAGEDAAVGPISESAPVVSRNISVP